MRSVNCAWMVVLLAVSHSVAAEESHWAEGTARHNDGANREHYNRAALLRWKNFMGDWRDTEDVPQGASAYATAEIKDDDSVQRIEWDVTELVQEWTERRYPDQGFFLRVVNGRGNIVFASREAQAAEHRPQLILEGKDHTSLLRPVADTHLTSSTYRSQGHSEQLQVSTAPVHLLIRFDLANSKKIGAISKATLVLHSTQQYGSSTVGVFRCRQGESEPPGEPQRGIAAQYPDDHGIQDDPRVIFAADFESSAWQEAWTQVGPRDKVDTIAPQTDFKRFAPLRGRALQSKIAKGSTTALNTIYRFQSQTGREPEEVYFRYYLRLADDWNQTVQGGKLPGISGTYGRAGWGGRKSNGKNGWSARGLFKLTIPQGNPLAGTTPVGFYCYHADMPGSYGTNWVWSKNYLGYLRTNRWYALEQYCKLNVPCEQNGILRAWVDGRLAFEKTDVRFRLTDELKIEQVWMNVYHGGTTPSPYDQHVFIDNVVIANSYIGPMSVSRQSASRLTTE